LACSICADFLGGLEVSEARRLCSVAEENSRLKKLMALVILEKVVLKDIESPHCSPQADARARGACRFGKVSNLFWV